LAHAVLRREREHRLGAEHVEAVVLALRQAGIVDDGHVDHGLHVAAPEQVLHLALADVEVVDLEVLRCPGKGTAIDSDHPICLVQHAREHAAEIAADPGDEDGVARHPLTLAWATAYEMRLLWNRQNYRGGVVPGLDAAAVAGDLA